MADSIMLTANGDWVPQRKDESKSTLINILMAQNAVQFILEDLELLLCHESIPAITGKAKATRPLKENLETVKYFLESVQETWIHHPTISDLVLDISKVMEALLAATDSYVWNNIIQKKMIWAAPMINFLQHYSKVASLVRKIKIFEGEVIAEVPSSNIGQESNLVSKAKTFAREVIAEVPVDKVGEYGTTDSSRQIDSSILGENVMVGFDVEASELLDKLTRGTKQLEVISVIGMGGIGKTTLAKRLYNDPRIVLHFHVLAWTSVSERYQRRNVLQNLLSLIDHDEDKDRIFKMSDEEMQETMYKSLKGRRYFIVMDDVWCTDVWNDLKFLLPEDYKGSRILLTSRFKNVPLEIKPDNPPHLLRFLDQDESWDLFRQKVFSENIFPEELAELGKRIVRKCKGLPLAIVVIAGVLAKEEKTGKLWWDMAENIQSSTSSESMGYIMDILELSLKHLPMWLRSCFLYLGTYRKDHEVPAKRLIWSWIGEGFIQHAPGKRLEDVAEECLMDLINRSLVIVVKKSSDGGIKSCEIHDLLRELCLRKVKEKQFLQPICDCHAPRIVPRFRELQPDSNLIDTFSNCRWHYRFPSLSYVPAYEVFTDKAMSGFMFLRRLELRNNNVFFPEQILQLIHLRYLALRVYFIENLLSSIFKLWNLETCILDVKHGRKLLLPENFWRMVNLRHFQISEEVIFCDPENFWTMVLFFLKLPRIVLENLQTISRVCPSGSIKAALARTPNLRNLGLHVNIFRAPEPFCFPELAHLNLLQTIKFECRTFGMVRLSVPPLQKFPPNLKKLTLIGSHVRWEEMSIIGLLPNLEILKIKDNFFSGPLWETSDDGFRRLKFLKLSHMNFKKWISSSDHFPKLEHLVLNGCPDLEEIPPEIGDIPTLQTIKVYSSSNSTMKSADQILESQKLMGNDDLKVFIYHQFEELQHESFGW